MERELKFRVDDPGVFAELLSRSELAGYTLARSGHEQQQNTYYDTSDGQLRSRGYSLRVRDLGTHRVLTLKWNGRVDGATHERNELEAPLGAGELGQPWPAGELGDLLGTLLGPTPLLQPLFTIATERHKLLAGPAAAPVAEVALDHSTVLAGELREQFYELEAEQLPGGNEGDVQLLDTALRGSWPLVPEERSKFERGLRLLDAQQVLHEESAMTDPVTQSEMRTETDAAPAAAEPITPVAVEEAPLPVAEQPSPPTTDAEPAETAIVPALPSPLAVIAAAEPSRDPRKVYGDDDVTEAARKVLAQQTRKMEKYEAGVRSGGDAEDVHQMRVVTRRMRATLALTRDVFDRRVLAGFAPMLRQLARALGAVRDRDVFLMHIDAYRATLPEEQQGDLDALVTQLQAEQKAAQRQLLRLLDNKKLAKSRKALTKFVNTAGMGVLPLDLEEHEVGATQVRHRLGSAIWSRYEELRAYETALDDEAPETLHQMRIAGKRLRYTLELFEDVLESARYKETRTRLMELQDHLGNIQDAEVSLAYLQAFDDTFPSAGLESYIASREQQRQELVEGFPKVWGKVGGLTFRRRLADVLTQL